MVIDDMLEGDPDDAWHAFCHRSGIQLALKREPASLHLKICQHGRRIVEYSVQVQLALS